MVVPQGGIGERLRRAFRSVGGRTPPRALPEIAAARDTPEQFLREAARLVGTDTGVAVDDHAPIERQSANLLADVSRWCRSWGRDRHFRGHP